MPPEGQGGVGPVAPPNLSCRPILFSIVSSKAMLIFSEFICLSCWATYVCGSTMLCSCNYIDDRATIFMFMLF